MRLRIDLAYDGGDFHGWATQPGLRTVQGELESALYGVSAPVLDRNGRPLAVLSIWGPKDRVPERRFAELGPIVVEAAREVGAGRPGGAPAVA